MTNSAKELLPQVTQPNSPLDTSFFGGLTQPEFSIDQLVGINYFQLVGSLLPEILHEANNELAVLQGSGELLQRSHATATPEQLERRATSILKASSRLTALCHLLERNPSGNLTSSSCELMTLFQSIRNELIMLNDFDRVTWRLEPSEALSVECPGWGIKQIILNLVSNSLASIRTQGGTGEIVTQFTSSDTDVSFHWRDSGVGSTPHSEVNHTRDSRDGGSDHLGLGLYVVTQLLARYGGSLERLDGPGGMVTITVPRANQN